MEDLTIFDHVGEIIDEDAMTTLSDFEWAGGATGSVASTGTSVVSTSDWAFLARTSHAYDLTHGLEVEVDTWEDTSNFTFWFTTEPGVSTPARAGTVPTALG